MRRFEVNPDTHEPFLQEPQPEEAQHVQPAPVVSHIQTSAKVISAREQGKTAHADERQRQEAGNRGPDEEPGFGQGG